MRVDQKPSRGFWEGQRVSTSLPVPIIDSKICLTNFSINDFLNYFDARKFGKTKGFTIEWVAKRI